MNKDTSTISKWERGEQNFSVSDLMKVAEVLNCPPSDLIENGDGLSGEERDLVQHLRAHEDDRRILFGLLDTLKANRQGHARKDNAA